MWRSAAVSLPASNRPTVGLSSGLGSNPAEVAAHQGGATWAKIGSRQPALGCTVETDEVHCLTHNASSRDRNTAARQMSRKLACRVRSDSCGVIGTSVWT